MSSTDATLQKPLEAENPQSTQTIKIMDLNQAIAQAQYNDAGIAMTPLGSYEIGGQEVDVLLVSMQPGVSVAAHLHRHGGESQMPVTPIRAIFGKPNKDENGEHVLNQDGQVLFELIEDRILQPHEIVTIPADFVHGYSNPSQEQNAHIIFNLPRTHTTAEDKLLADITLDQASGLVK